MLVLFGFITQVKCPYRLNKKKKEKKKKRKQSKKQVNKQTNNMSLCYLHKIRSADLEYFKIASHLQD